MNQPTSNTPQPDSTPDTAEAKIARWIYEATRVEAEWSKRPIVPEPWEKRDDKFRNQFVDIIDKYMDMDKLIADIKAKMERRSVAAMKGYAELIKEIEE